MPTNWSDAQRKFYDDTAHAYAESFQRQNRYAAFVTGRFLGAIRPEPGERILELGSSGGRFTVPLLERGCRVTGVDISRRSIEYLAGQVAANPQRENLTLVEDDAGSLAHVSERDFDAVVGAHILHHVEDPDAVARRAFERLRPGGRAVFLEPNPWNPQWYVQITVNPRRRWRIERGFLRVWPWRVRQAFLRAGFRRCEVTTFGCFPPFVLNWLSGAMTLEAALERIRPLTRLFTLNLFRAVKE